MALFGRVFLLLLLFVSAAFSPTFARRGRGRRPEIAREDTKEGVREGRFFSLFNIVSFKNDPCMTDGDDGGDPLPGTCLTSEECDERGGTIEGNCAAGFGVCCRVILDEEGDDTVRFNSSYVQNVGFPKTNMTTRTVTFDRIDNDVVQIRLDFETLEFNSRAFYDIPNGVFGECQDYLLVTSPTGASPPRVCGDLTGQHMYFETGTEGGSAGKMEVNTQTGGGRFNIRVSYIAKDSPLRAPQDCAQYLTGPSGSFQSYGYPEQSEGLDYLICFRREQGSCGYQLSQSGDTTFNLKPIAVPAVPPGVSENDVAICTTADDDGGAYLQVQTEGAALVNGDPSGSDLRCGDILSNAQGDDVPGVITSPAGGSSTFFVRHVVANSDLFAPTATGTLGDGFDLSYTQLPC